MRLLVKTSTGKRLSLEVQHLDTIEKIKAQILTQEGIPLEQQCLVLAGKELKDGTTLTDYDIQKESKLQEIWEIHLKTMTGRIFTLVVEPSNTTWFVMAASESKEGVPIYQQRIIFGGKQLEGGRTLRDYKIQNGSMLDFVPRLSGGGGGFRSAFGLTVKMATGKLATNIAVTQSDTVGDVKTAIQYNVGIACDQQQLFHAGRHLNDDSRMLEHYGIDATSSLDLVWLSRKGCAEIKFFVKTLKGHLIAFEVPPSTTIGTIKTRIENKEEVAYDLQALFYSAQVLEDDRTLEYYNIKDQCTLNLVLRIMCYIYGVE